VTPHAPVGLASRRLGAGALGADSRSMNDSPAHALLRRLASGDQKALGEFYDLYAGLANGLALRILRDSSDAEDVVQEAFVQVWRQASRYDPGRGSPQAWLCTIARTRALDRLRRRASRREDISDEPPAVSETPQTEEAIAVRDALGTLSSDQRRALELAYYEGLTQSEIALRLGEPLGTIKTRIRTAMIRLRETLGPEGM
jgi:RNA polymerase sigma-70 factor, ECF subfamily